MLINTILRFMVLGLFSECISTKSRVLNPKIMERMSKNIGKA